jgi:hypothetical protein
LLLLSGILSVQDYFFCCCSLQICNKCNPKTTHFSYYRTVNGTLWQFFVWLHFVTTSIADVLNAVECGAPFDIYTRCLFALEHVKREFDLIKGKLQTMLKLEKQIIALGGTPPFEDKL